MKRRCIWGQKKTLLAGQFNKVSH